MLYLERHDLHLMSFPEGKFQHRIIPNEEAKTLIEKAISEKQFLGTYKSSGNPKRADKKFNEFIDVLTKHYNIELPLKYFFHKTKNEDGKDLVFGNPPGLSSLKEDNKLLIVDYSFTLKDDKSFDLEMGFDMDISIDSVKFHLFELIS